MERNDRNSPTLPFSIVHMRMFVLPRLALISKKTEFKWPWLGIEDYLPTTERCLASVVPHFASTGCITTIWFQNLLTKVQVIVILLIVLKTRSNVIIFLLVPKWREIKVYSLYLWLTIVCYSIDGEEQTRQKKKKWDHFFYITQTS